MSRLPDFFLIRQVDLRPVYFVLKACFSLLLVCSVAVSVMAQEISTESDSLVRTATATEHIEINLNIPKLLTTNGFLGLHLWQWLGIFLACLLGIIVNKTATFLLRHWYQKWLDSRRQKGVRLPSNLDFHDLEKPLGLLFGAVVFVWVILVLQLPGWPEYALALAAKIVISVSSLWSMYLLIDFAGWYFEGVCEKTETKLDDLLLVLMRRTMKVFVTAFGVIFIVQNLFENVDVSSLFTGLGLGGLAFALAAKETLGNLFGSLTVLTDQPFHIGDWVVIGDAEGTVEDVGLRSTRIRTFYNSQITLPNSRVIDSTIDNLGRRTYRRWSTTLMVTYDTSPTCLEAFCEGIRELIRLHPYTRKDYFLVYFNGFGASQLEIMVYMFWQVPDWCTEMRERNRMCLDIMRLAKSLGVQFAFPTQTIHLAGQQVQRSDLLQQEASVSTHRGGESASSGTPRSDIPDYGQAREWGIRSARELVYSTLGNPVEVPPPVTFD